MYQAILTESLDSWKKDDTSTVLVVFETFPTAYAFHTSDNFVVYDQHRHICDILC